MFVRSIISIDIPIYNYRVFESVNHISKRKWGKPFVISKKVANATDTFISTFKNKSQICNIRRYTYTAYLNELKAIKNAKEVDLGQSLDTVIKDKDFKVAVKSIKHKGKFLTILSLCLSFRSNRFAKKIIYEKL